VLLTSAWSSGFSSWDEVLEIRSVEKHQVRSATCIAADDSDEETTDLPRTAFFASSAAVLSCNAVLLSDASSDAIGKTKLVTPGQKKSKIKPLSSLAPPSKYDLLMVAP
jgi:hypothetical protein